ncbi:MAG TPA: amidohydrolase family protein [Propionibacteriaceae bacterium]|nr:amidohydrolase family protein [Propionibacteriaceae bacterium]
MTGPSHSHGLLAGLVHTHTHDGSTHTHAADGTVVDEPLHLHGTLLPQGETKDVWVVGGRVTFVRPTSSRSLGRDLWILPGLVDAHCHIGLGSQGAVDRTTAEAQALTDRDTGALLLRDAGSPADTRWVDDRADLPEIIRAGRHVARTKRYLRNYAEEVEPSELVEAVAVQARRGDGWVKLVGDWIDRDAGDLAPSWPAEAARAAIERAHAEGARVTAHCFGEQSVSELVAAGIDGIEHGTGLDDDTIATMAARGVALVPTLDNLDIFPGIADQASERFPTYAAHMRALYARRYETFRKAFEAGVPMYAGTDAGGVGPHGRIAREVAALAEVGGAEFALGAASWRARDWLGRPCLGEGERADLVAYTSDPLADPAVVARPRYVVLRGRIVVDTSA